MATKPCRVLVVDDDKDTAQTFAYILVTMGHEAAFLTDAHQVMEAAERTQPDIIFLDIGMPGMDGWEVARRLRSRFSHDGALRLVAISGRGDDDARIRSRQAGFDAHIQKPVDPALVEAIISQFFR